MKKTILVTGAGGFLGSNFIKKFNSLYKIICFFKDKKKITSRIYIRHEKILFDFLKNKRIKIQNRNINTILHAASINENLSKKNIAMSKKFHHNAIIKIVELAKKNKIKKIIKLSTIKVYGQNLNKTISENTKVNPKTPYANNIFYSDRLLLKLGKKNNIKIIILRLTNGFGRPIFKDIENTSIIMNNFCFQAKTNNFIKISSKKNYLKNFISLDVILKCINFFINSDECKNGVYLLGSRIQTSLYCSAQFVKKHYDHLKNGNIKILHNFQNLSIPNKRFKISLKKIEQCGFSFKENKNKEIKYFFN
jgi:UDP-glucose 4-epimerase